mmetsp:Transcript_6751/g.21325  ORF Transcript_6751/g.21325 Transcript_6751/m.21325 type:complete len:269 (-) Transcript_6751:548-1354(-)
MAGRHARGAPEQGGAERARAGPGARGPEEAAAGHLHGCHGRPPVLQRAPRHLQEHPATNREDLRPHPAGDGRHEAGAGRHSHGRPPEAAPGPAGGEPSGVVGLGGDFARQVPRPPSRFGQQGSGLPAHRCRAGQAAGAQEAAQACGRSAAAGEAAGPPVGDLREPRRPDDVPAAEAPRRGPDRRAEGRAPRRGQRRGGLREGALAAQGHQAAGAAGGREEAQAQRQRKPAAGRGAASRRPGHQHHCDHRHHSGAPLPRTFPRRRALSA